MYSNRLCNQSRVSLPSRWATHVTSTISVTARNWANTLYGYAARVKQFWRDYSISGKLETPPAAGYCFELLDAKTIRLVNASGQIDATRNTVFSFCDIINLFTGSGTKAVLLLPAAQRHVIAQSQARPAPLLAIAK